MTLRSSALRRGVIPIRGRSTYGTKPSSRHGRARPGHDDRQVVLVVTLAAPSRPSGTRPPRGRIGGPRGWPRPPATGRGACRRRRTPWRRDVCVVVGVGADVAARVQLDAGRSSSPARAGPTNPIASSTRSALSWNSLPGISRIACGRRRPCAHSTRAQSSASTWPFVPTARLVATAQSRSHPSSCELEVRSFMRPVRPGQRLVLALRRLRQDLELRHRGGALAVRGADAVGAGVAAADHHDVLALGADRAAGAASGSASPATRLFCWVRKSIAKWMPCSSRPGTGRSRGASAPPVSTTASNSASSSRPGVSSPISMPVETHSLRRHLRDAAVDQGLLHLEVGNAVAQQAADAVAASRTPSPRGRRGRAAGRRPGRPGRSPRRPRACRSVRGRLRHDPAFLPAAVDDRALDRLDGHRVVVDVERAGRLARRRADAAGEFGKLLVECSVVSAASPLVAIDQVVPVRDHDC